MNPGGLGAILSQIDTEGNHHAIRYTSRKLTPYEKNYMPLLLEMQGMLWGIEHFKHYLQGRHFLLFTDHQPLTGLSKVYKRTYQRLNGAMNHYDFEMIYKKGEEMPVDYLSRNVISAISWSNLEMANKLEADEKLGLVRKSLINSKLPSDLSLNDIILKAIEGCFIEDNVIWKRIQQPNKTHRVVIYLPSRLIPSILQEAQGMLLASHDRILKTKERIMQCYFWPRMDADIQEHIQKCHKYQVRRRKFPDVPHLLSPLPQCTEPQQHPLYRPI